MDEDEKKRLIKDIMNEFKDVGLISEDVSRESSKPTTPIRNNLRQGTPEGGKDTSPFVGGKVQMNGFSPSNGQMRPFSNKSQPDSSVRFNSDIHDFKQLISMDYSYDQSNKNISKSTSKKPPKHMYKNDYSGASFDEINMSFDNVPQGKNARDRFVERKHKQERSNIFE